MCRLAWTRWQNKVMNTTIKIERKKKFSNPSATVEKASRRKDHRRRKRRRGRILLAAVLFLLAVGSLIFARSHWTEIQAQLDILPDGNAKKGSLYGEPFRELDAGNFWVLVNQLPTLEEGSQTCNIRYENPSSNHYSARVSLYLMETGELLGYTRRVDPGTYVETIRIRKALPAGEYPVRAILELFEDKKPAGDMSLEMILRVVKEMTDQTETENQLEMGDQPKKEDHLEKKDQSKKEGQNKESETG